MKNVNIFDSISVFFSVMFTSQMFVVLIIFLLFLLFIRYRSRKHKSFIKIKNLYLASVFFISLFVLIVYHQYIFDIFDYMMDNLFIVLFFPNFAVYFASLIILNIAMFISINSKNINLIIKKINIVFYCIYNYIFVLILDIIYNKDINVFDQKEVYGNYNIRALINLSSTLFIFWILFLIIYKVVRVYQINKLDEKKLIIETFNDINKDNDNYKIDDDKDTIIVNNKVNIKEENNDKVNVNNKVLDEENIISNRYRAKSNISINNKVKSVEKNSVNEEYDEEIDPSIYIVDDSLKDEYDRKIKEYNLKHNKIYDDKEDIKEKSNENRISNENKIVENNIKIDIDNKKQINKKEEKIKEENDIDNYKNNQNVDELLNIDRINEIEKQLEQIKEEYRNVNEDDFIDIDDQIDDFLNNDNDLTNEDKYVIDSEIDEIDNVINNIKNEDINENDIDINLDIEADIKSEDNTVDEINDVDVNDKDINNDLDFENNISDIDNDINDIDSVINSINNEKENVDLEETNNNFDSIIEDNENDVEIDNYFNEDIDLGSYRQVSSEIDDDIIYDSENNEDSIVNDTENVEEEFVEPLEVQQHFDLYDENSLDDLETKDEDKVIDGQLSFDDLERIINDVNEEEKMFEDINEEIVEDKKEQNKEKVEDRKEQNKEKVEDKKEQNNEKYNIVDLENESEFMSNSDFDDFFDEDDIEMSKNKIDKARIVNSIENDDFDENEVENLYHSIR